MSSEDALARAEELLERLEAARARLEATAVDVTIAELE